MVVRINGMHLCGEILGRSHPIPQWDRHQNNPLAGGDPGDNLRDQMDGGLRHMSPGTGVAQPAPLATEHEQQILVAGVTAQPQRAMGQDTALYVIVEFVFHIGRETAGCGAAGGGCGATTGRKALRQRNCSIACCWATSCARSVASSMAV